MARWPIRCGPLSANGDMVDNYAMVTLPSFLRSHSLRRRIGVGLAALLAVNLVMADDAAVKDAAEGFRFGDAKRVNAALAKVRGHLLERYVEYWSLRLRLDTATPEEIDRFLKATAGTAVGDRLRVDWLRQLGKTGDWVRFAQFSEGFDTDDSEVACLRTTYAAAAGTRELSSIPRGVWDERLTDACAEAFAWLVRSGKLSVEDARWRLRTSGDGASLLAATRIAAVLDAADAPSPAQLQRAWSNPQALLREGSGATRATREAALIALTRLARSDVASARALWSPLRARFRDDEQRYAAAQLASASARRLDTAEALEWAARAREGDRFTRLADAQAAWIARAALRGGAWSEVLRAISAMSATAQADPTWRYWRARALVAQGQRDAAQPIYTELARDPGFYGLLAAEEIHAPLPGTTPATPATPTAARINDLDLQRFDQMPAAKRALKLSELGLRADAAREWYAVVKDFDDAQSLTAAEWMRRKGVWDRSINTAERTRTTHDFSLRYQTPYKDEISNAATQQALDQALVFGLIRQESRFWAEAVSSAGALGLMQVMPATAKWVAGKLKATDYRPSQLASVAVNTGLGTFYLRTVLDQMEGSEPMAAAAYNAGPGRARAWRADVPLEGAIYAESIPFNETRDYVKKVLANAVWYAHLRGSGNTSLKARLGIIPARER